MKNVFQVLLAAAIIVSANQPQQQTTDTSVTTILKNSSADNQTPNRRAEAATPSSKKQNQRDPIPGFSDPQTLPRPKQNYYIHPPNIQNDPIRFRHAAKTNVEPIQSQKTAAPVPQSQIRGQSVYQPSIYTHHSRARGGYGPQNTPQSASSNTDGVSVPRAVRKRGGRILSTPYRYHNSHIELVTGDPEPRTDTKTPQVGKQQNGSVKSKTRVEGSIQQEIINSEYNAMPGPKAKTRYALPGRAKPLDFHGQSDENADFLAGLMFI